jgi:MtrB/PioB family decaheme-associated outer membrane protein
LITEEIQIMKKHPCDASPTALALAVRLALLTLCAAPALAAAQTGASPAGGNHTPDAATTAAPALPPGPDVNNPEVKDLTCRESFVELGVQSVSRSAPKFGEYNGMPRAGGYGLGNFNLASDRCQHTQAYEWEAYGYNLGTNSRNLGVSAQQQGKWAIGLGFDQLRHYTTTGFQTPYQGGPGGNVFTLPSNFQPIFNGAYAAGQNNVNNMTAAQLAAFRNINVYNERKTTHFKAGYALNADWNFNFAYKRIDMSGGKLIGGGSEAMNAAGEPSGLVPNWAGQVVSLKLNPNKSTTDMFTLGFNWAGQKAYAMIEYYASLFRDGYSGFSWANPFYGGTNGTPPAGAIPMDTMSTPPSNQLHQLNLSGGYFLSQATRLTGGVSLGVNTQNMSYNGAYTPGFWLPTAGQPNSLNGKVVNMHADAKLTHKFSPAFDFSTGFKYNERDNRTDARVYNMFMLTGAGPNNTTPAGAAATATTAAIAGGVGSAPMSNRRLQFDMNLDYRIDKNQKVRLSYDFDHYQRWCNNMIVTTNTANNANVSANFTNAGMPYTTPTSCAQVPSSTDNALTLSYKRVVMGDLDVSGSYTFADRRASVNPFFYNPMQNFADGYENIGWLAWFQAPRREHTFKGRANWQVNDQLGLGITGQYVYDRYRNPGDFNTALGVQKGNSGSLNFDATFQATDNTSYGAYLGWSQRSRNLTSFNARLSTAGNPAADGSYTGILWGNKLDDSGYSIGLNAKQKLLHGKFQLSQELSYDFGKTRYTTYYVPGRGAEPVPSANYSPGATPDLKSGILSLRLVGTYDIDKKQLLTFGYQHLWLKANDYLYAAYQYGSTATAVLPNNMREPTYHINAVFIVYRYTFR